MIERNTLIAMVARARDAVDRGEPYDEMIAELEAMLPGTDIGNLCFSDYAAETIADLALRADEVKRVLDHAELTEVVRQFYSDDDAQTEADSILLLDTFIHNCVHPAGRDLLLDPGAYFKHRDDPTADEIAALALMRDERDL